VVLKGENVLFVCTKKQLKNILQAEARACGAFYVTERWLGGTLTNFQTIKKQIKRLKELEQAPPRASSRTTPRRSSCCSTASASSSTSICRASRT